MTARAPITVDGNLVGYLSLSWSEEMPIGEGLPPAVGLGTTAPSPGALSEHGHPSRHGMGHSDVPEKHGPTFRHNIGPGHRQREQEAHDQPHVTEHEKHDKPTFRPHLTPRGSADAAKPEHFTVADIKSAIEGNSPGAVDRRSAAKELAGNEALIKRYATMTYREVNQGASDRALTAQAETAANRAIKRGHSLERALWGTREHGNAGYYPPSSIEGHLTDAELQHFKTHILPRVLSGSDVVRGMTGNASDAPGNMVRSHQIARGTPYTDEFRREGGDTYFMEDRGNLPRLPGTPVGVTRLPAGDQSQVHPEGASKYVGAGMPEQQALTQARKMAAQQGFDPKKVTIGKGQDIFKIGKGPSVEDTLAAGDFNPSTGIIRLYPKNFSAQQMPGILSHELFHAKVEDYTRKHGWPSTQEILSDVAQPTGPVFRGTGDDDKRVRSIGPGAGRRESLVSPYGEEYLKAIPQGPVFRGSGEDRPPSIGPGAGRSDAARDALNENLAEMARIKYESGGHAAKFAPGLESLYDKIEKSWRSRK